MLNQYGFDTPRSGLARDAEEAVQRAVSIGFPVAMKVVSPQILHKTDISGVVLGVARALLWAWRFPCQTRRGAGARQALKTPEPFLSGRAGHLRADILSEHGKIIPEEAHNLIDVRHVFRPLVSSSRFDGDENLLNNEETRVRQPNHNSPGTVGDSGEPGE